MRGGAPSGVTVNYTVSFNSSGGSFVPSQIIPSGNRVSRPTNPTKSGFNFVNWYQNAGLTQVFDFNTAITGEFTLYAKWNKLHTVKFNVGGGSAISSQEVENGKRAVAPPNPSRSGYAFVNWYQDAGFKQIFNFNTLITEDTTLYAEWNKLYTVSFNANGGSSVSSQEVASGGRLSQPSNPTKSGAIFGGWFSDSGLTQFFNFSTVVTGNVTLYAKWTKTSGPVYTVTFNANGGSSVGSQQVASGSTVSQPSNPNRSGYTFAGWYTDSTLNNAFSFTTAVTGNVTLYAKWTKTSGPVYTVTFNANGGSSVSSQRIASGSRATKPNNPIKSGYSFAGWYTDSAFNNAFSFITAVTGNVTLYAKWTKVSAPVYTVTFNANGGGSVSSQRVTSGNTATQPTNPNRSGWSFAGWYTDSGLSQRFSFSTAITGNLTLYAKWSKQVYTVSFNTKGGSSVSSQRVAHGNRATQPSNPTRTGYTFKGWAFNFSTAITGDITISVNDWEKKTYTVSFNTKGGSSVSSQRVAHGNRATQPSNPTRPGYTFKGWAFNFSTAITGDITISVNDWEKKTYTVSFNTKGGSSVSSQRVAHGNRASQPSNPTRSGYTFGGWNFDFNTAITSSRTIYARSWSRIYYTVSFDSRGGTSVSSQRVAHGERVSQPSNPTRSGYNFGGWNWNFSTAITSSRTIYANNWVSATGSGPGFNWPIAIDYSGGNFYVLDRGRSKLMKVDSSGNRSDLATIADGGGLDVSGSYAYVTDNDWDAVWRVSLSSGSASVISGKNRRGSGDAFSDPNHIYISSGEAWVVDTALRAVFKVNLNNGDRTKFSYDGIGWIGGSGNAFSYPVGIYVYSSVAYVTDAGLDAVIKVEADGDRSYHSKSGQRGSGPALQSPVGIDWLSSSTKYLVDEGLDALVRVDSSGNRSIISSSSRGSGPNFGRPRDVYISSSYAYVVDADQDAIIKVDLSTGNRTIFSKQP